MSAISLNNTDLIFGKITNFVSSLSLEFGSKQMSLLLYNRYLQTKVTSVNSKIDQIEIFRKFINENHDAVMKKDASLLKKGIIVYTNKCNIKLNEILKSADKETQNVVWDHLLVIYKAIDPSVDILKMVKGSVDEKSNEGKFLNDMMGMVSGLGNGGGGAEMGNIFQNMMNNDTNGLDMSKLFGMIGGMFNMLNPGGASSGNGEMPNIGAMFSQLGNSFSQMQTPANTSSLPEQSSSKIEIEVESVQLPSSRDEVDLRSEADQLPSSESHLIPQDSESSGK